MEAEPRTLLVCDLISSLKLSGAFLFELEDTLRRPQLRPLVERIWGGDALADVRKMESMIDRLKEELGDHLEYTGYLDSEEEDDGH